MNFIKNKKLSGHTTRQLSIKFRGTEIPELLDPTMENKIPRPIKSLANIDIPGVGKWDAIQGIY